MEVVVRSEQECDELMVLSPELRGTLAVKEDIDAVKAGRQILLLGLNAT